VHRRTAFSLALFAPTKLHQELSVRIEQVSKHGGSGPSPRIVPLAVPPASAAEQSKNKSSCFQWLTTIYPAPAGAWHASC